MSMSAPIASAQQALEHPKDPEFVYEFAFRDYLAKLSISKELTDFLHSFLHLQEGSLPVHVEALGVFTGKTVFEHMDSDDFYDKPRPFRTGAFESGEDLNSPFEEKEGVVSNPVDIDPDFDSSYHTRPSDRNSVEIVSQPGARPGMAITLRGGSIRMHGNLVIPAAPELTRQIATGYESPRLSDIGFWIREDGEASSGAEARSQPTNIVRLERVYDPTPTFTKTPYKLTDR